MVRHNICHQSHWFLTEQLFLQTIWRLNLVQQNNLTRMVKKPNSTFAYVASVKNKLLSLGFKCKIIRNAYINVHKLSKAIIKVFNVDILNFKIQAGIYRQ